MLNGSFSPSNATLIPRTSPMITARGVAVKQQHGEIRLRILLNHHQHRFRLMGLLALMGQRAKVHPFLLPI